MTADKRATFACLAAVLLGGLVYVNALHNPFVYDDYVSVVENPSIQPPLYLRSVLLHRATRPIVNASYAFDRVIWGPAPFGFHVTSVLLHMLNVALLFLLAWRYASDRQRVAGKQSHQLTAATTSAVLFAVHPMMTEAVGYVSGRSEVICGTFFLLSLLAGRQWIQGERIIWAVLTTLCWGAAVAAKEVAIMFPVVLVGYDFLIAGSTGDVRRRLLRIHLPLFALAAAGGLLRLALFAGVEYPGENGIHWQFGLVELNVFARYLFMLIAPTGQSIFHQIAPVSGLLDPQALLGITVFAGIIALAWRLRAVDGIASLGLVWFVLLLVPSALLVMLNRGEPMAEHRVYFAAAGLFLAAGTAVGWFMARTADLGSSARMAARAFLFIGVLALCGHTLIRNSIWSDPVALLLEAVHGAPNHYRAWVLLGEALHNAGRGEEAVDAYQRALQLRPQELGVYVRLARYQAELGRLEEAESTLHRLQTLDPVSDIASNGLGAVAMLSGQTDEARQHFLKTIEMYPRDIAARQSLAQLEESQGNPFEALKRCEEIRSLAPQTPGNDACISRNRSKIASHDADRE